MELQPYTRTANYYETDQMGIIHHSNYIRWFEEARIDFMRQMGYTYARMEDEGVISFAVGLSCEYKTPVRFGDTVVIQTRITELKNARMAVAYTVTNAETGAVCATGDSRHCFANSTGRPVALKKVNPALYQLFESTMKE